MAYQPKHTDAPAWTHDGRKLRLLAVGVLVLALVAALFVTLRPEPASAAVGAYPYIKHDGRCTIDVGTTSPDRARANTLANGQQVKPGYRVGKVAAPKGCILTVRSLAGTQTVTTKGILTWVNLPRKTEGFVEITSRR